MNNENLILNFVNDLSCFHSDIDVSNQYQDTIQRNNLIYYLIKMYSLKPNFIMLGDFPSSNACNKTGIPFTSNNIIKTHPFFYLKKFEAQDFTNDLLSSMFWAGVKLIESNNFNTPLLWNVFPFYYLEDIELRKNLCFEKAKYMEKHFLKLLAIFDNIDLIYLIGKNTQTAFKTWKKIKFKNYVTITNCTHPTANFNNFISGLDKGILEYKFLNKH